MTDYFLASVTKLITIVSATPDRIGHIVWSSDSQIATTEYGELIASWRIDFDNAEYRQNDRWKGAPLAGLLLARPGISALVWAKAKSFSFVSFSPWTSYVCCVFPYLLLLILRMEYVHSTLYDNVPRSFIS